MQQQLLLLLLLLYVHCADDCELAATRSQPTDVNRPTITGWVMKQLGNLCLSMCREGLLSMNLWRANNG
jgi:hypothetical protein